MKMIVLLYLDGDQAIVHRLLKKHQVKVFSELAVEGHGQGAPGWYGAVAPYESRMTFTLVPEDRAEALLDAVHDCSGCQHPEHPVHAIQLGVERAVDSGVPKPSGQA